MDSTNKVEWPYLAIAAAAALLFLIFPSWAIAAGKVPDPAVPIWMFWVDISGSLFVIAYLDFGHGYVLYQTIVNKKGADEFGPLFRVPFLARKNRFLRLLALIFVPYGLTVYFFAILYGLISRLCSDSFHVWGVSCSGLTLLQSWYFSLTTASTVGYGDIAPNRPCAYVAVMSEIILSVFFAVFLFSVVGSALIENAKEKGSDAGT